MFVDITAFVCGRMLDINMLVKHSQSTAGSLADLCLRCKIAQEERLTTMLISRDLRVMSVESPAAVLLLEFLTRSEFTLGTMTVTNWPLLLILVLVSVLWTGR